jgi:hypothetical protein
MALVPFEQRDHQCQVASDPILLVQEHLLTVRFAGHDIHPNIERGLDGEIGGCAGALPRGLELTAITFMSSSEDVVRRPDGLDFWVECVRCVDRF